MSDVIQKIKMVPFPTDQYMKVDTRKTQIYVHHTASSPNPYGVVDWWKTTPERVSTSFVIAGKPSATETRWKDGDIIQLFSSANWGWHLGLTKAHLSRGGRTSRTSTQLNSESIGIEICNWGQLRKTDKGFINYAGGRVADADVCELTTPFKGFKYYQKYTTAQLDNTAELITFLGKRWNIPVQYQGDRIFDICPDALQGKSGVWTHNSVRPDKFDVFPQPEIIQMLKSL
jgi:N-acetyl-anhydromuramyl-L-alanine amidase AmpD